MSGLTDFTWIFNKEQQCLRSWIQEKEIILFFAKWMTSAIKHHTTIILNIIPPIRFS